MVRIYKGDDVDFADLGEISVSIVSTLDIDGFTGQFAFMGIVKQFGSELIALKAFTFSYTAAETSTFCLGVNYGTFTLFDTKGRKAVVAKVCVEVVPARGCAVCCSSNKFLVDLDNSFDYGKMGNKPKINGVTVEGDYDGRHYGLQKIPEFDPTDSYAAGEQVIHDGALWLCVSRSVPQGAWNRADWTRIGASVLFFEDASHFPQDGDPEALYIDRSDSVPYRWNGTAYVSLLPALPSASDVDPLIAADVPSPGESLEWSRGDHVHPAETALVPGWRIPSSSFPISMLSTQWWDGATLTIWANGHWRVSHPAETLEGDGCVIEISPLGTTGDLKVVCRFKIPGEKVSTFLIIAYANAATGVYSTRATEFRNLTLNGTLAVPGTTQLLERYTVGATVRGVAVALAGSLADNPDPTLGEIAAVLGWPAS